MRLFALCILLSSSSLAFQLPFRIPFLQVKEDHLVASSEIKPARIAVVGAGAGGSSAAFWISKAKERFGIDVEVDVFDREAYVGGSEYPKSHSDTRNVQIEATYTCLKGQPLSTRTTTP
jgi:prenylcysteine oxidase/farnesylcysteine lyase